MSNIYANFLLRSGKIGVRIQRKSFVLSELIHHHILVIAKDIEIVVTRSRNTTEIKGVVLRENTESPLLTKGMGDLTLRLSTTISSHTFAVRKNATRLSHLVYKGIKDNLELFIVQFGEIMRKPSRPKLFTASTEIPSQISNAAKLLFFILIEKEKVFFFFHFNSFKYHLISSSLWVLPREYRSDRFHRSSWD